MYLRETFTPHNGFAYQARMKYAAYICILVRSNHSLNRRKNKHNLHSLMTSWWRHGDNIDGNFRLPNANANNYKKKIHTFFVRLFLFLSWLKSEPKNENSHLRWVSVSMTVNTCVCKKNTDETEAYYLLKNKYNYKRKTAYVSCVRHMVSSLTNKYVLSSSYSPSSVRLFFQFTEYYAFTYTSRGARAETNEHIWLKDVVSFLNIKFLLFLSYNMLLSLVGIMKTSSWLFIHRFFLSFFYRFTTNKEYLNEKRDDFCYCLQWKSSRTFCYFFV